MMVLGIRAERERRKWRQYQKAMEEKRQQYDDEIRTMEMLLDAHWDHAHRCFVRRRLHEDRAVGHVSEFYDRWGNRIPDPTL